MYIDRNMGFSKDKQISPVVIESSNILNCNVLSQNVTISQVLVTILLNILSFYFKDIMLLLFPNVLLFIFYIVTSNDYILIKLSAKKDYSETKFDNVDTSCNKYNLSEYLIGEKFSPLHLSLDGLSLFFQMAILIQRSYFFLQPI